MDKKNDLAGAENKTESPQESWYERNFPTILAGSALLLILLLGLFLWLSPE